MKIDAISTYSCSWRVIYFSKSFVENQFPRMLVSAETIEEKAVTLKLSNHLNYRSTQKKKYSCKKIYWWSKPSCSIGCAGRRESLKDALRSSLGEM